jgi:hypothetical protein
MSIGFSQHISVKDDDHYLLTTTVGVCEGNVDFSQQYLEAMISESCYLTYKKHG